MITGHFHGSLGKKFGKTHKFKASTIYLWTQGVATQLGDKFRKHIKDGEWIVIAGEPAKDKSNSLEDWEVHQKLGANVTELHFYPAVTGRSALARVILGIVLIVVGIFTYNPYLIAMGASLAIGGIAGLLSKKPKVSSNSSDSKTNYNFNGGTNTNAQGIPVPLVYGRVQCAGSVVVSYGTSIEVVPPADASGNPTTTGVQP
jgi:predicted phage tail protein